MNYTRSDKHVKRLIFAGNGMGLKFKRVEFGWVDFEYLT